MNQAVASAAPASGGGGGGGYTVEEVAKHNTKNDCWVILGGKVLDVTSFLGQHPGGELAILTFAGKDATEEFDMIHPPDVVGKYAPDAIIGVVGVPGAAAPAAAPVAKAAPASGAKSRNYEKAEQNRKTRMDKEGRISGWF